jgi:hypothetical protein
MGEWDLRTLVNPPLGDLGGQNKRQNLCCCKRSLLNFARLLDKRVRFPSPAPFKKASL